jgi:hypothetical protein
MNVFRVAGRVGVTHLENNGLFPRGLGVAERLTRQAR